MTNLLTGSNFKNDWYGWITNQCGHVVLGLVLFTSLMFLSYSMGEFAPRIAVWSVIAIGYCIWEFVIQRGYKWDGVEDCIFVCGYGAGIPAIVFHEAERGSPLFSADIMHVTPIVAMFCFHATVGVLLRVIGNSRQ